MKDYPGPVDDMIVFALSALLNKNQIFVDNTHYYGVSLKYMSNIFQIFAQWWYNTLIGIADPTSW